jgi:hypothetical protein
MIISFFGCALKKGDNCNDGICGSGTPDED